MNKLKIFIRMDIEMKMMVLKSLFLTAYYRFSILFVPFSKLAKRMGTLNVESNEEPLGDRMRYVWKVRSSVMMTSKNTPWQSLCLVQALTAQRLLKKKGIENTVYLGLSKDKDQKVIAHAWIRCGDKIVVGEKGMQRFSVVAKFGSVYDQSN